MGKKSSYLIIIYDIICKYYNMVSSLQNWSLKNINSCLINIFNLDIIVEWNRNCCILVYTTIVLRLGEGGRIIVYVFNRQSKLRGRPRQVWWGHSNFVSLLFKNRWKNYSLKLILILVKSVWKVQIDIIDIIYIILTSISIKQTPLLSFISSLSLSSFFFAVITPVSFILR